MWKIQVKKGQNVFVTSDCHYNHKNICRGVTSWTGGVDKTRDFKTLEHMNTTIVNNINEVVGQDDILINFGDWSFGGFESIKEFRDKIICKNVYLLYGNHDHHIENNREGCQGLFVKTAYYQMIEILYPDGNRFKFVGCHFPIVSWDSMNKGVPHLFGHVHLPEHKKTMRGKAMDIGMDGNNLYPYNIKEIMNILSQRPNKTSILDSDHHEEEVR